MGTRMAAASLVIHRLAVQFLLQRPARQIGHDQPGLLLVLAVIQHLDDVGMRQAGERLGFAFEADQGALQDVGSQVFRADDLDRHVRLQAGVVGFIDGRHAPFAELLKDVIASNGLTG